MTNNRRSTTILLALLAAGACRHQPPENTTEVLSAASPPPPAAAADDPPSVRTSAAESGGAQEATPTPSCTQVPSREAPIAQGDLGHGSRMVELLNTSDVEVQVRLLDELDEQAVEGTLLIEPQGRGVFLIEPGSYRIRLRENATCQVFDGTPFTINPEHAGVTIALSAIFMYGSHHELQDVDKEL